MHRIVVLLEILLILFLINETPRGRLIFLLDKVADKKNFSSTLLETYVKAQFDFFDSTS